MADTLIAASFPGLIVSRQRDPGDVVVTGSPVLSLISTEQLWISAWVDETAMADFAEGQPARIVFRSEPLKSYDGQVFRLGKEADRETREFVVDVELKDLPENWAVGQRAEVYIETDRKSDATLLPTSFVVQRESEPSVFVAANGRASQRPIWVGLRGPDMVEVSEGLAVGDIAVKPADHKREVLEGGRVSPQ